MKLSESVDAYILRRKAGGFGYEKAEWTLAAFCKHAGNVSLKDITFQHVVAFLDRGHPSVNTWRAKHTVLKKFIEFWTARGARARLVMPLRPVAPPQSFAPYIYKRDQIRALLRALRGNRENQATKIDNRTFRTLLLVLYGTGGMPGEVIQLLCRDVDLIKGFVNLGGNRIIQARRIPISPDVRILLQDYLQSRERRDVPSEFVFVGKSGKPLSRRNVGDTFRRLCGLARIVRCDGAQCGPGVRDFRPTFAVHRIASWMRNRSDLNRMIPALSAYLGHASLATTEQYLSLTPERFRQQLTTLSPQRNKKRWRDDPALMRFLAGLTNAKN
jgi:integrase